MIGFKPAEQRIKQSLPATNDEVGAAHVLGEQQRTAQAQDPVRLSQSPPRIGNRAQGVGEDHGVERPVSELQGLGVADAEFHVSRQFCGANCGNREHVRGCIHADQPNLFSIVRKAEAGADAHLQDVSAGATADPAPSTVQVEQVVPASGAAVV